MASAGGLLFASEAQKENGPLVVVMQVGLKIKLHVNVTSQVIKGIGCFVWHGTIITN